MQRLFATVGQFSVKKLKIEVHETRAAAGAAAAEAAADALRELGQRRASIGVIFATGASQLETLRALREIPNLPWGRVRGFHMDEYIGIPADHAASFRRYLRDYAETLRSADPQLCLLGIGENGHLAFNDPADADFNDSLDMKIVRLDDVCRKQQAAEGWFKSVDEVPELAMTLTIPTLLRVPKLIVSVPGSRKAKIMRRTLNEAISTACPATILRTHPDATVYLDKESAAELERE
jgi:glucosamine-6-phosphate deaminase